MRQLQRATVEMEESATGVQKSGAIKVEMSEKINGRTKSNKKNGIRNGDLNQKRKR